jgi:hypothetical protein
LIVRLLSPVAKCPQDTRFPLSPPNLPVAKAPFVTINEHVRSAHFAEGESESKVRREASRQMQMQPAPTERLGKGIDIPRMLSRRRLHYRLLARFAFRLQVAFASGEVSTGHTLPYAASQPLPRKGTGIEQVLVLTVWER